VTHSKSSLYYVFSEILKFTRRKDNFFRIIRNYAYAVKEITSINQLINNHKEISREMKRNQHQRKYLLEVHRNRLTAELTYPLTYN